MQCHREGDAIPPTSYSAITEDSSGNLWLGSQTALIRWRPGSSTVYTPPALASHAGIGISAIAANPDGSLWIGMALRGRGLGLQHFEHGKWKSFVVPGFDSSTLVVLAVALDRNNTLWIGTSDRGIYRISGKQVDHFGSADGLSGDSVRRFFEDREGNVWVATSRGIDCFHDVQIASFSKREGITVTELDAVLAAHGGTVWIGGADALNALHENKVTSIHAPKGVPGNQYTSLLEDHAGQMWIGIDNALWIYTNGAFHRVTRRDERDTGVITDIAEDVDNNIWAESIGPPRALLRIRGLTVEEELPVSVIPAAHTIAADRESGIWLGLLNGDLARYRRGNLETFHFEHALPSHLFQISVDPDGSVLGATLVGLIGWRNGTQRTLTIKNGLPCDAVFAFVRDSHGALWLYTQCGLIQIAATALLAWWEHSDAQIPLRVFDSSDGVQPEGAPFRSAARSPDGRLWFVNLSLLQMIDPGPSGWESHTAASSHRANHGGSSQLLGQRWSTPSCPHEGPRDRLYGAEFHGPTENALSLQAGGSRYGVAGFRDAATGVLHGPSAGPISLPRDRVEQRWGLERNGSGGRLRDSPSICPDEMVSCDLYRRRCDGTFTFTVVPIQDPRPEHRAPLP